ncbi:hypothetical protein [Gulosibacter bifidus]|uniref:Uncharacterized protein n=1 Tax=Gulosibacter bifidus TaxID=272239 RepID=A0ABW5RG98_9MICO|nr:hypothetical protein [Gulosibacter bifidus]
MAASKPHTAESQRTTSPALKTWISWGCFAILAIVWVTIMVQIFTTKATVTGTNPSGEVLCYALSDSPSLNYVNANVASNMGSAADEEYESRQQHGYPGADIENAVLQHEIKLMEDRACEAQRAGDAAKCNLIGIIGGVTLTCWVVIATRRSQTAVAERTTNE